MRLQFPLTSDQLELLLAFEEAKGLAHLAELMAKDASVVSRNLQRVAEDLPVLEKVNGRWKLTALGIELNLQTRAYLQAQKALISKATPQISPKRFELSDRAVLIVINAQNGLFHDATEKRNNEGAEKNILRLLSLWRSKQREVIHVKHVSDNPESRFFRGSNGSDFLSSVTPTSGEDVIEKTKSSAFTQTELTETLNRLVASEVVLVGFTANDCIDATARNAAELGFTAVVVSDATATFDLRESTGRLVKADRIHKLTLLNIHSFSANVLSTLEVLQSWLSISDLEILYGDQA